MNGTLNETDVFLAALEIDAPDSRAAYLDDACAGDAKLRQRVEALLRQHLESQGVLDAPPPGLVATIGLPPITEEAGTLIGPYKLLQQIGEGGMGVVFMAEQTEPLQRTVALKIIKPGMDTRQVIARFEAERQALAMMDHPNIARVIDAGTTDTGRPYFVMDLVKGVPITEYCDAQHLPVRARLELMADVCQAVQHAHQKGIIHRDLKPSNVLVAEYDGKPVPKIIDFGVAKATAQRLTERTMFTQYGQIVGTFEYMSPEQARFNQLDVDTRSDIYSLGVLLYELLAGSTPLEKHRLRSAAFDEILRLISEEDPPRPSTRLSSSEALPSIAANRHTEPARLSKDVSGELDWIVMKCIEKDRKRRYESANGIAADIERYLNDETVQACPPSRWYRFQKFARRNKAALGIASAATLALLIGVVGLSASNAQIKREQKQTEQALFSEQQAKNDLTKSLEREQQVLSFQRFALAERELVANNIGAAEELLHECPENLRGFEWRLLKGLHSGPQVLRGSGAGLLDVAVSPDGRLVASADMDPLKNTGQLILWDGANGRKIATLSGHDGPVACVVFSPDGKRLASFGSDRAINIWDLETRKVARTLAGYRAGHGGCLAFSPDGTSLAFASWDQGVRVWDLATGDEKLVYRGHRGIVTCVAFSPDGRRLASGGSDGAVRLWDARTGKDLLQLSGQSAWIFSLAFSPDGQQVASAGAAGLCAWDANTGRNILPAQGITRLTLRAAFSADGKRLIAGHQDGTVRIWDLETGRETLVLRRHSGLVTSVALSADGNRLVTASLDGTVRLWYPPPAEQTAQTPRVLSGHTGHVVALAFSPDHRRLASSGLDDTVRIWDLTTGKASHTLQSEHVLSLAFSADGEQLTTVSFEGSMTHWNVGTGQPERALPRHLGQVLTTNMTVAFRPDGQRLTSVADENTVKVWDVSTGQEQWKMIPPIGSPHALILAYSADGRQLAGAAPGAIRVWDADDGAELHSFAGPAHIVPGLAFHPDGHQLATASVDGLLTLRDSASGKELRTLRGHTGFLCLAYSPDGRRLASGGGDNTVLLWDTQTGEKLATLRGHIGAVWSLAYSGDGTILATASGHRYRGEIQLWDTAALEKKQND